MTKKQMMINSRIAAWKRSTDTSLDTVYKSCSSRKHHAWIYCRDLCDTLNGTDLKVVSHNCMVFSAAFQFTHPKTGVVMLMYITRDNNYEYDMN